MQFNLSKTVGHIFGKTLASVYHSVRHPFSFAPKNLGSIFIDIVDGVNSGLKTYNQQDITLRKVKNFNEQMERETNLNPS